MSKNKPKKALKLFISTALLIMLLAYNGGNFDALQHSSPDVAPLTKTFNTSVLSKRAITHILYGDHNGGGHKHGIGKPCKSEFPATWDDEKIIATVKKIAANDNLAWKKQNNGFYVTEYNEGATRVRVVMGKDHQTVITAYPTNLKRNYCPKH